MFEKEYKKEAYFCNKCKRFHKPLFKNKRNTAHIEHFAYISKYQSEFSQAELWKLSFKKMWKQQKNHN